MTRADDEIMRNMDELSEEFEGRLKVIETAGGTFWSGVGEETVEIGAVHGEEEDARKEVSLQQVMTELETLMAEKRARLKVLMAEYTRIRQDSVKLAITILGEEKVSLVDSASGSIEGNNQTPSMTRNSSPKPTSATSSFRRETIMPLVDIAAAKESNESFEEVYDDAEAGLTDLQHTLDELVVKNLEENKGTLKVRFLCSVLHCVAVLLSRYDLLHDMLLTCSLGFPGGAEGEAGGTE